MWQCQQSLSFETNFIAHLTTSSQLHLQLVTGTEMGNKVLFQIILGWWYTIPGLRQEERESQNKQW